MNENVAIVGGGLAGLTAAALVARGGRPVTLFEKASSPGGRAATRRIDGYHLNLGAHALYAGGAAVRLLGELGVTAGGGAPQNVLVRRDGRLHRAPTDLPSLFRTDFLNAAEKLELVRFFARAPFVKPAADARLDAQGWLDRNVRRPRVRDFLTAFGRTTTYTAALDLVSAEALLARLKASMSGPVRYVDGGWQSLVDGLRAAAEKAGARVEIGARVERIEVDRGRVRGVRLADGRLIPASSVVVATPPAEAAALLPPELSPLPPSGSFLSAVVACLDLALDRLPRPDHPVVQDLDGPRFLTVQSVAARIAPPGGAVVHAFKQLDPRAESDPAADQRELEAFVDDLQPGWRDHVVDRAFLPRMQASAILPTAAAGGFTGRPAGERPDLPGVYLAGDWVGAEGFQADAAMASAERAARAVLGLEAVRRAA